MQQQRIILVELDGSIIVLNTVFKFTHSVIALRSVHKVTATIRLQLYSIIVVLKCFAIVLQRLVALPLSIVDFLSLLI